MASSTASLESVIKSEQFPFRRIPAQSIPTVIVTNEVTNNSNQENTDSNGGSALPGAAVKTDNSKQDLQAQNKNKYGRVIISLENPILPEETINNTPSRADGLDSTTENDLRLTGCKLIQISGILLRLPQVAMATGQVLFQRYYYSKSFVRFPMETTAIACVVLASKVEEAPRRIRDILNVFHNMKQIRLKQLPVPMLLNEAYVTLKNQVIKAERRILKELGFCVHVKHPHKYIITVAEILGQSQNEELIQAAWSYMNDSLHTNVFVRFSPETIACACIHLSARILKVPLPTNPQWYFVFGVDSDTLENVCKTILLLYTRTPLSQEELEEKVEGTKKALDDAKLKAKVHLQTQNGLAGEASMDSIIDSRTSSPVKYSDAAGTVSSSKSLEVLSVINRLKQQQHGSTKSSPVKSFIAQGNSNPNSVVNSTSSTPIKLEKSPRTLVAPAKRSRSPSPHDRRRNSRERNTVDSYSSGDDSRSQERTNYKRYRNGHSNTNQDNADDYKESRYRESENSYRSRSPPRSYVSSTVSISSSNNADYIPAKYRRRDSRSRSPSYEQDQYNKHKTGSTGTSQYRDRSDRYDDRYASNSSRHEYPRSRKSDFEYDSYNSDNYRDRRDHRDRHDDYRRSRSPYTSSRDRHRDEYRSSRSSNRKSKY